MKRDAVKLAQTLMNSFGAAVLDDGVWGQVTQRSWLKLSEAERLYISERVLALEGQTIPLKGLTVATTRKARSGGALSAVAASEQRAIEVRKDVHAARDAAQLSTPALAGGTSSGWEGKQHGKTKMPNFISKDAALSLAEKWNSAFDLPPGSMAFALDLEAQKVPGGYDPAYKGGYNRAYWGLYQFDNRGAAWQTARNFARSKGVSAPAFSEGWFIAEHNTAMAAAYAGFHAGRLRAAGLPVTPETLYACHQQGFGGFSAMVKSGATYAGPQSSVSVAALRRAVSQSKQVA